MRNLYRVTFNIPGHLPESDPAYFDSLDEARTHVSDSWDEESHVPAGEPDAWRNEFGAPSDAYWDAIEAIGRIESGMGADHPAPGNPYRWTVEECDAEDVVPDDDVARQYLDLDSGATPCTRYGSNASECASVAILAESIMAREAGESTTFRSLDSMMGFVVNDSDDVARLLADNATEEELDSIGQDRDSVLEWAFGDKEEARLGALRAFLVDSGDYSAEEFDSADVEPSTYDDSTFDAFGNEYRVLDDSEADSAVLESTRESVWAFNASFLADYMPEGIDADEINAIRGDRCEDANAAMLALIAAGPSDLETLARSYADADGRGHALAHYDGEESEVEHAGRTWYVYRVN